MKPTLKDHARAARQAAERFAARGDADAEAVSSLMADRYAEQANETEERR